MMEAKDVSGKEVNIDDIVAFGHDNGSTLLMGKIFKVTPKKVWMNPIVDGKIVETTYCRDHDRVSKVS
jgi:hypothetical protein